ncbi:hypothetical protein Nizo1840_0097 [Lactiplantibacillus plantarum]|nr:hypothetical protein SF2A35B_0994 [Lactiplantibacillus plantarum]KZT91088.1 hypothetical protein Nizo1840_0097 [Lactiplantibacillus plantarum]
MLLETEALEATLVDWLVAVDELALLDETAALVATALTVAVEVVAVDEAAEAVDDDAFDVLVLLVEFTLAAS